MEQSNPLLEPVILQCLFDLMPHSTWKSCRLVCKLWHDILLRQWRNDMVVRVSNIQPFLVTPKHDFKIREKMCLNAPNFKQNYEQPRDLLQLRRMPFRNMYFFPGEVTIEPNRTHTAFWNQFGQWLKHLHLDLVWISDVELLKQILFNLTPNLVSFKMTACRINDHLWIKTEEYVSPVEYKPVPNPQRNLKLFQYASTRHRNDFSNQQAQPQFPISWMQFFSAFLNIEELQLQDKGRDQQSFLNLINTISTIRTAHQNAVLNIKKWNLRKYGFEVNFCEQSIPLFCQLALPLTDLQMHIDHLTSPQLQELIRGHHHTLTKVTLENTHHLNEFQPFDDIPLNTFPLGLVELNVSGQVFGNWDFLSSLWNLVSLRVWVKQAAQDPSFPIFFLDNDNVRFAYVTKFSYDTGKVTPSDLVKAFVKAMPSVKTLMLNVDSLGFEYVCDGWSNLTLWEIDEMRIMQHTFVKHANKLTSLEILFLVSYYAARHEAKPLEDFGIDSIENGFLQMPKLICLTVSFPLKVLLRCQRTDALAKLHEKLSRSWKKSRVTFVGNQNGEKRMCSLETAVERIKQGLPPETKPF